MPTKNELENQIYEKMSQENAAFLAGMKTKSPDEIISHAYEIACRDNLLMLFEDETSLSERQLAVLTEFEHPLSQLYTDWLSRDTDEMDAFRDSIACCADDILRKRVEEKYRDHPLSGRWAGSRECHILPDWLLIYRLNEGILTLTLSRTGSHSDLF